MASLTQPVDKSVHPLEPPSWWLLPTPVTLDTLSVDHTLGLVGLVDSGLQMLQPVYVRKLFSRNINCHMFTYIVVVVHVDICHLNGCVYSGLNYVHRAPSGDQSQWWSNGWSEFLPHLFPDWRGLSTTHPLLPVDEGGRVTHDQHSNPQLWHSLLVRRWSVQLSGHPHLQSAWGTTHCSCSLQHSLHEWVQSMCMLFPIQLISLDRIECKQAMLFNSCMNM